MQVVQKRTAVDYYYLITTIAIKSLKVRYKNSILGFMWSFLTPLLYLAIFTFVFSQVFPDIDNYPLYALTGLIFWTFFSSTTAQLTNSIVESSGVLKSINIPPIAYPAGTLIAQFINLMLTLLPFTVLMYAFGFRPQWSTLVLIPAMLFFAVFTYGLGLIIAAFNVYFRDVGFIWQVLTPALFYSTPIAFSSKWIPEQYLWILKFNPLFHFIELFRAILYYGTWGTALNWGVVAGISLAFLGLGYLFFKKLEPGFISNY
ncbi:MAG: ABC transporter permease [Leptolyngbya sp. SIO3F4]|nr:ABC transporter permease [Leptolyngbya sp. SIO3F4]